MSPVYLPYGIGTTSLKDITKISEENSRRKFSSLLGYNISLELWIYSSEIFGKANCHAHSSLVKFPTARKLLLGKRIYFHQRNPMLFSLCIVLFAIVFSGSPGIAFGSRCNFDRESCQKVASRSKKNSGRIKW